MDYHRFVSLIQKLKTTGMRDPLDTDRLCRAADAFCDELDTGFIDTCIKRGAFYSRVLLNSPLDDFQLVISVWQPNSVHRIIGCTEYEGIITAIRGQLCLEQYRNMGSAFSKTKLQQIDSTVLASPNACKAEASRVEDISVRDARLPTPVSRISHPLVGNAYAIKNLSQQSAASLHVYLNPSHSFKYYDHVLGHYYRCTHKMSSFDAQDFLKSTKEKASA